MTVSVPLAIAGIPAQGPDVAPQTAGDVDGESPELEIAETASFDCIFSARTAWESAGRGNDRTDMLETASDPGVPRLLPITDGNPMAWPRLEPIRETDEGPHPKREGTPDSNVAIKMSDEGAVALMPQPDPSSILPTGGLCEQGVEAFVAKVDGMSVSATAPSENASPSGRRLYGRSEAETAFGIAGPTFSKAITVQPTTASSDSPTVPPSGVELRGTTQGSLETAATRRAQLGGTPEGATSGGESVRREGRTSPHPVIDGAAPPLAPTPIVIGKSGKIDPAFSAGGPAINEVEKSPQIFTTAAKSDEYSVREPCVNKGTRRAKGDSSMKSALLDPAAKAPVVSMRTVVTPVDSLEETIGFERNRGRGSELPTDTTPTAARHGTTPAMARAESLTPTDAKFSLPNSQPSTGAPDVAPAMRLLHAAMEKSLSRPGHATSLELDLPMQDGRPVRVSLELRGDEVRAVFRTESQDMRNALEQAWPQFTQRWQDRGVQFGDARFESSWNQQTPQERDDARRAPRDSEDAERPVLRSSNPSAVAGRNIAMSASSVSLWA